MNSRQRRVHARKRFRGLAETGKCLPACQWFIVRKPPEPVSISVVFVGSWEKYIELVKKQYLTEEEYGG